MSLEEKDEALFKEGQDNLEKLSEQVKALELKGLLAEETDHCSVYFTINSGAGGTEACDWVAMLYRMYTRYCEKAGYKVEVLDFTDGDAAGYKSISFSAEGPMAYGYLKAESGVHRLVRISPFDSNGKRHTSFASVFAWPMVDDEIEVEIKTEDIRIDTYRASGAGGQHINKTDSAVRITHAPTGVVVQCQTQRSQHANKDSAMKMLRAALYEKELQKREEEKNKLNSSKKINEWGSQIRSYVLHPYKMVKDHRTSFEMGQAEQVLDGRLDGFIESYLRWNADQP